MQAMIFAAGLGTRLAPFTDNRPKALVNFNGRPMLENVAEKLIKSGVNRLVINVHHFPDMVIDFIKSRSWDAEVFISDERDFLLDTGGGMLKARDLLSGEENFLLYNTDIVCDLDVRQLWDTHVQANNLATLSVKDRNSTRKFVFDCDLRLCGWKNFTTSQLRMSREVESEPRFLAFSGISVISSRIFDLITETGKFSITDVFLRLAASEKICGVPYSGFWADLGTVEKLSIAEREFCKR